MSCCGRNSIFGKGRSPDTFSVGFPGSGRASGDGLVAKGQDCYEVIISVVQIDTEDTGRPDPAHPDRAYPVGKLKSWRTWGGTSLMVQKLLAFLKKTKAEGQIIKMCICESGVELFALKAFLSLKMGISMGVGKWSEDRFIKNGILDFLQIYTYVNVKPSCIDHSGGFLGIGVTKKCGPGSKKCRCADYKGVSLKDLTEKTKEYTASDGSKITVGPSLDYKKVIEKIVEHEEKVMKIDCANEDPDAILVPHGVTKGKYGKRIN